ncbi:hypothetical protein SRHO_G00268210 [Serrasalmus rhombeus]
MTWHFSIAESKNQTGKFAQGLRLRQVDMLQEGITRSSATLSKLASKLRKVCKSAMKRMRRAKKQKIGSPREVVMIDESKFGHKRKYSQGRSSNRKSWVFGMLGVQARERRPVLRIVKRRSKRHLMPILKNYVRRGSTCRRTVLVAGCKCEVIFGVLEVMVIIRRRRCLEESVSVRLLFPLGASEPVNQHFSNQRSAGRKHC